MVGVLKKNYSSNNFLDLIKKENTSNNNEVKENIPDVESKSLIRCNQCDYVTEARSRLNRHVAIKHNVARNRICPFCYKGLQKNII